MNICPYILNTFLTCSSHYRFEGGGHTGRDKHGIEGFPTLDRVKGESLLQTSLSWFDMVLAALDCYTWVFGENLLTPADLFGGKFIYSVLQIRRDNRNNLDFFFLHISAKKHIVVSH